MCAMAALYIIALIFAAIDVALSSGLALFLARGGG